MTSKDSSSASVNPSQSQQIDRSILGKMLLTVSKGRAPSGARPAPVLAQYLRRIVKWQQMDIEYAFWQMLHLCTPPKVVYGENLVNSVFTVISVAFFLFLLAGTILATCCWFLTNTYMREEATSSHVVEQRVEWTGVRGG